MWTESEACRSSGGELGVAGPLCPAPQVAIAGSSASIKVGVDGAASLNTYGSVTG